MLKEAIIAAIAELYCTTAKAVLADIEAMPEADQCLDVFCKAMDEAGY